MIWLYLANCHKGWLQNLLKYEWPRLPVCVESLPGCWRAQNERNWFSLETSTPSFFFFAGGHSINEAFVLCYCWSSNLQNDFDPICPVFEETKISFIEDQAVLNGEWRLYCQIETQIQSTWSFLQTVNRFKKPNFSKILIKATKECEYEWGNGCPDHEYPANNGWFPEQSFYLRFV